MWGFGFRLRYKIYGIFRGTIFQWVDGRFGTLWHTSCIYFRHKGQIRRIMDMMTKNVWAWMVLLLPVRVERVSEEELAVLRARGFV